MLKTTANREWREVTRGAPEGVPTGRTVHAFAQRVEALAIAGCDKRHAAEIASLRAALPDARIELLSEMLEDLAKAVWMLDRAGFIGTLDEDSEAECAHLRGIARRTVDAYTAYKRPPAVAAAMATVPAPQPPQPPAG